MQAAQSRIRSNLTQTLNRKMRRPTDVNASKFNGSQQTSSINTEDCSNSEEEPEKQPSENSSDSAGGDVASISIDKSYPTKIQDKSQEAQAKRKIEEVGFFINTFWLVMYQNKIPFSCQKIFLIDTLIYFYRKQLQIPLKLFILIKIMIRVWTKMMFLLMNQPPRKSVPVVMIQMKKKLMQPKMKKLKSRRKLRKTK